MWVKRRKKTPIYEEKRIKNWVGTAKKVGFLLKKIKKFTKFNPTASNMQYFFFTQCDVRYLSIIVVGYCHTLSL